MRYALLAAMIFGGALLVPADAWAQKKAACPKDPLPASVSIWPAGAIQPGKTVVGRHSCGRSMQCMGGTSARKGGGRECRWL
jgi:hypothetical protein